jgi:hypothetical protein
MHGVRVYYHDLYCPLIIILVDSVAIITDRSSVDLLIISNNAKIIIDNTGIFKKNKF